MLSRGVGKPTVRRAHPLSGRRTTREANADGRKAVGNRGGMVRPSLTAPHNRSDTRLMPGPERVLTRVG